VIVPSKSVKKMIFGFVFIAGRVSRDPMLTDNELPEFRSSKIQNERLLDIPTVQELPVNNCCRKHTSAVLNSGNPSGGRSGESFGSERNCFFALRPPQIQSAPGFESPESILLKQNNIGTFRGKYDVDVGDAVSTNRCLIILSDCVFGLIMRHIFPLRRAQMACLNGPRAR
jgi:hypothetical protein